MTVTLVPERLARLDTITLDKGSHESPEQGMCFIEFADWLAGGKGRDNAPTVSPVIRSFGIAVNDAWSEPQRQKLRPFGPRIIGTAGDGQDEARSYLALDWLVRTYTPAWLDLAGLTVEARELRDLRRIVDLVAAQAAGPVVRNSREKAAVAWDAAGAAAGAAARDAAWDAAWAAAGAAAGDAAWDAAWDAAGDAAGDAAWAAAGAAARDAARDAAGAAARAAARDAAWAALQPTVATLQASALDLLEAMVDPSAVA